MRANTVKIDFKMEHITLLIDSRNGTYIPQIFVEDYSHYNWNIKKQDMETLKNPDNEWYWESWENVINTAYYMDNDGVKWTLHHDGDLFAIAHDKLTSIDKLNFFGESYED